MFRSSSQHTLWAGTRFFKKIGERFIWSEEKPEYAAFLNKGLLEHSQAHSICGYFHDTTAELSSYNEDCTANKVKNVTVWLFIKNVCWRPFKFTGTGAGRGQP